MTLAPGIPVDLPYKAGWDVYFYVISGVISGNGQWFAGGEHGLIIAGLQETIEAAENSLIVAFLGDPRSTITKAGTTGDHREIPRRLSHLGRQN